MADANCPCGSKRLELCHHNGCAFWTWPNWTAARNEVIDAIESFLDRPYCLTSADVIETMGRYQRSVHAWSASLPEAERQFVEQIAEGTWKPGDFIPSWGWPYVPDDFPISELRGAA